MSTFVCSIEVNQLFFFLISKTFLCRANAEIVEIIAIKIINKETGTIIVTIVIIETIVCVTIAMMIKFLLFDCTDILHRNYTVLVESVVTIAFTTENDMIECNCFRSR